MRSLKKRGPHVLDDLMTSYFPYTSAHSFRTRGWILSGPGDLLHFNWSSSFSISSTVNLISGSGCCVGRDAWLCTWMSWTASGLPPFGPVHHMLQILLQSVLVIRCADWTKDLRVVSKLKYWAGQATVKVIDENQKQDRTQHWSLWDSACHWSLGWVLSTDTYLLPKGIWTPDLSVHRQARYQHSHGHGGNEANDVFDAPFNSL